MANLATLYAFLGLNCDGVGLMYNEFVGKWRQSSMHFALLNCMEGIGQRYDPCHLSAGSVIWGGG